MPIPYQVKDDEGRKELRYLKVPEEISAEIALTKNQKIVIIILGLGLLILGITHLLWFFVGGISFFTFLFTIELYIRVKVFCEILSDKRLPQATFDEIFALLHSGNLSRVLMLIPVHKESGVIIEQSILAANKMRYDWSHLEIRYLFDESNEYGVREFRKIFEKLSPNLHRPESYTLSSVPVDVIQNKPHALNYALADSAGARIIGIWDADDIAHKDQLLQMHYAFERADPNVFCVQCRLVYVPIKTENLVHMWIAAQSSIEYDAWFLCYLPYLVGKKGIVPLGGTSNYFLKSYLMKLNGWDPHCVTEDKKLAVDAAMQGLRTIMIDSFTLEAAVHRPLRLINQRSRWEKGGYQTLFVYLRRPLQTLKRLGLRNFLVFLRLYAISPLVLLAYPFFFLLSPVYWVTQSPLVHLLYPQTIVYFLANVTMVMGNILFLKILHVSARKQGHHQIGGTYLYPFYYLLISFGEWKGLFDFLFKEPSEWNHTVHDQLLN